MMLDRHGQAQQPDGFCGIALRDIDRAFIPREIHVRYIVAALEPGQDDGWHLIVDGMVDEFRTVPDHQDRLVGFRWP